jgi:N-acyl-D-aspartate/D-glutamate deacylase
MQEAVGYRMTVKAGAVTFEDGEPTGALPGRLVRGTRAAPA